MTGCAMNVYIHKAGGYQKFSFIPLAGRCWNSDFIAAPYCDDLFAFDQNDGIRDFILRSKRPPGENCVKWHDESSYWKRARRASRPASLV